MSRGRIRAAALIAIGAALSVLLVVWWLGSPPPTGAPSPAPRPTASRSASGRAPATEPRERAAPDAAPEELAPRTPHEEALNAAIAFSGEGWIRCPLPADTPPLQLERLNWAGRHGAVLTMAATEPEGEVALYRGDAPPKPERPDQDWRAIRDLPVEAQGEAMLAMREEMEAHRDAQRQWEIDWGTPVAVATWTGAEPGLLGHCEVTPADRLVEVRVTVVDEAGQPLEKAYLTAGVIGGSAETDASGTATLDGYAGIAMRIHAIHTELTFAEDGSMARSSPRMGTERVTPTDAGADVQITVAATDLDVGRDATAERVDEALAELDGAFAEITDPLEQALDQEGLSAAARAQLQTWRDRALARQQDEIDQLERFRTMLDEED